MNRPIIIMLLLLAVGCQRASHRISISGLYLGQEPPGMTPEIFAPGIVSTSTNGHSPAIFSPDGNELFWSYYDQGEHVIMHMVQERGRWSVPERFITDLEFREGNPFFSHDGSRLIFHSGKRGAREDGSSHMDFWCCERLDDGWREPELLPFPPNDESWNLYGCQTASGNIYFTSKVDEQSTEFQLCFSRFKGETWEEPEPMPGMFNASDVNWTPFVSPDESYIIFSSDRLRRGEGYHACDLFVSFRDVDDAWMEPVPLGDSINTGVIERFPWVSPDGKYLFFVRGFGDVYWVDAGIIEALKLESN